MTEQIIPIDADELEDEFLPTQPAVRTPSAQRQYAKAVMDEAYSLIPQPIRVLSKTAIAAFALGLLTFWTLGLTAIPAVVFGHIALRATRDREKGRWMAVIGLVLGYASVAIFSLVIFGGLLYAILN